MFEDADWGSPWSAAEGAASVPSTTVWFGGEIGCSLAADEGAEAVAVAGRWSEQESECSHIDMEITYMEEGPSKSQGTSSGTLPPRHFPRYRSFSF